MNIVKLSAMAAALVATSVLVPQFTAAADLQPGKGWDAFNARSGEMVSTDSYMGTAMGTAPGQGYDTMHSKSGAPIEGSYQGTAMESAPGQGYDTMHSRSGAPI